MAVDLSMSVLVVDDYNTMIRIIRNLLKQLGFENIDDASDGSAALNKMRGKKYGLVISDWNMEPMTGYDLLREVRADPNLATTPFIMITAESKTENVIAAKKAGVNNYIVKPFNAATLKTKIEAVFPDMATRVRSRLERHARSTSRQAGLPSRASLDPGSPVCSEAMPGHRAGHDVELRYHLSSRISARGGWPNSSFTEAGSSWSMPANSSAWMPRVTNRQSMPKPCAPVRSVRTESPIASTRSSGVAWPRRSAASAMARS